MSKKKPKTIGASYPLSFMGCEGEVIVEMTPTEAVSMIEKAWQENKRLRQENATLTDENELLRSTVTDCRIEIESTRAERDDARREICMNATNEPYRQMCGSGILLPQDEANRRGWDCFKEAE